MQTGAEIRASVEAKLGFFPVFLTPALATPQVLENLWQQTVAAYLDNPLPVVFKEKLSAYLSRYCAVPYCMICHSCTLRSLGVQAREILELLESFPPLETEIGAHLQKLAQQLEGNPLPTDNTAFDDSLLHCAVFIALAGEQGAHCRSQLRRLLGEANYQHLIALIAYIRMCHQWMEAHPEIAYQYEADQRAIAYLQQSIQEEPSLGDFFEHYSERVKRDRLNWTEKMTEIAAQKQREAMLSQLNAQLEQRVQERTAQLLRSNQELEQFAFISSHDLQEPLRKVRLYADLLDKKYSEKLDGRAVQYLASMTKGVSRMQAQLSGLLDYWRILREEAIVKPIALPEVLETVLEHMSETIAENRAHVTAEFLPVVTANPRQMEQLFIHLIDNTIKFRSQSPPEICIRAQQQPEHWLMTVADNGIGLKPQYAERIFEIFQRLHNRTDYPGIGIGLAICRKIVERHQGRIWIESQLGQGATVYFTLKNLTLS
ncbi:MAG: ATP-binding protein [Cyanophyceae cyanobacterium]